MKYLIFSLIAFSINLSAQGLPYSLKDSAALENDYFLDSKVDKLKLDGTFILNASTEAGFTQAYISSLTVTGMAIVGGTITAAGFTLSTLSCQSGFRQKTLNSCVRDGTSAYTNTLSSTPTKVASAYASLSVTGVCGTGVTSVKFRTACLCTQNGTDATGGVFLAYRVTGQTNADTSCYAVCNAPTKENRDFATLDIPVVGGTIDYWCGIDTAPGSTDSCTGSIQECFY